MARRRYISTSISVDKAINQLALCGGDFAVMLYTWMIPHAGDDGCLTGDPDEILMTVIPGRRDKTDDDVADALESMVRCGLIEWDTETVWFPPESFYRHQSYIKQENRRQTQDTSNSSVDQRETPENTGDQHEPAENAVSVSPSFPVSVSVPDDDVSVREPEPGESFEFSLLERRVIVALKQTRGMASVPDEAVALHLRDLLGARASPLPDEIVLAEAMKFRDHWNDKRSNQPANERWRGWRKALTSWFMRQINVPTQAAAMNGQEPEIARVPHYYRPFVDD